MMKTLMSATALTALVATTAAFGQTQEPAADPLAGNPPAAMEAAPGDAMEGAPGMEAQPMTPAPEAAAPAPDLPPQTQAEVPTLPPPENATQPSEQVSGTEGMFIQQQGPGEVLASSLIGSTVENPAGESLGDINDVVLTDEGIVDGIVIGVGGFLGIGEKDVAVSFESIEKSVDTDGNIALTLNATAQELEGAPQYVTVAGLRQEPASERSPASQDPASAPGQ
jgi:sporulation protein YlmC with PRC-barrel domain